MKKLFSYQLFALIIVGFTSCSNNKTYKLPENAIELLAGESHKTWKIAQRFNDDVRMNMSGCFLSYRITYQTDMQVVDNNGEQENCGPTLEAQWSITESKQSKSYIKWTGNQISELFNIDKDYKYFKILKLTKDTLKLQHRHKQFSNKSTFIDIFVPEHIEVKNRDFHW